MTPNQLKAAALHLSCACGHLDAIKSMEQPKSARWNAVSNLEDRMWKALDLYRLQAMDPADLDNAGKLIDSANAMIAEMYP